jgi:hypothetical protein
VEKGDIEGLRGFDRGEISCHTYELRIVGEPTPLTVSNNRIREGCIVVGSLFNGPMRVETVRDGGNGTWTMGLVGMQSERFRKVILTESDINTLTILDSDFSYDRDGRLLRLGLQAYSLGIAYEFDPYFGLSISRVDPLPHQGGHGLLPRTQT